MQCCITSAFNGSAASRIRDHFALLMVDANVLHHCDLPSRSKPVRTFITAGPKSRISTIAFIACALWRSFGGKGVHSWS